MDGRTENGNRRKLPYVESKVIGPSGAAAQKGKQTNEERDRKKKEIGEKSLW